MGVVLGLPVGAALGAFAYDNLALGLLVGAAVGLTLGVAADALRKARGSR